MKHGATTVIYNDACPVCSREMAGYMAQSKKHGLPVIYEPLTICDLKQYGLTPNMAARRFYAFKNGKRYVGIPAFAVLWEDMPTLRWLAYIVRFPVIRWVAALFYDRILSRILYIQHQRRQSRLGNGDSTG